MKMYLQKVISRKTFLKLVFVGVVKVKSMTKLAGAISRMDLRIRIHTKMSWIRNTGILTYVPISINYLSMPYFFKLVSGTTNNVGTKAL
jgi:hypothetical protein